jgi:RNA polymerase sigma-70 factor (ECF subfamily)
MQQMTNEELLKRIQGYNSPHDAFSTLVDHNAERFYGIAYRLLENRQDAEDIVQTCFMRLWHNPAQWDPDRGAVFTTWFTRVVMNECRMLYRKRKRNAAEPNYVREDQTHDPLDQLSAENVADTNYGDGKGHVLSEDRMDEERRLIRIREAVKMLPDRQKEALVLCFYEGVSNKDAAEIMDVGVKALESLLMRAKQQIKELLHDYIQAK